jgi:DcmR-like sensory protein
MVAARSASPVVHSVHFYDADDALIQRLQSVVSSSMEAGHSILIVATDAHRTMLCAALKKRGVDVFKLESDRTLICLNAHETLARFMVKDRPDPQRFFESVGGIVMSAKQAASKSTRGLTVFGEMVAVLWEQGKHRGALQLEALWNDLLNDRAFHLHCAYPRSLFGTNADGASMRAICEEHSHVVGLAAN